MQLHESPHFEDELDYDRIGNALSLGLGFKRDGIHFTAFRPPAQSLFIALFTHILGHHTLYIKIAEAILLAIVPFICATLGRSLGLSFAASNIGAALAALHPGLAYASSTLYPTVLTTCGLTLGIWLCSLSLHRNGVGAPIGAGAALGLTAAATTTFAPLAFLAGLILAAKKSYRSAVIIALLGTLPVLAWMERNELVLGRFTIGSNGGYNLYLGANDNATPMSGNWTEGIPASKDLTELNKDALYRSEAVTWIKSHPVRWGTLALLRSIAVFDSVGNPKTKGLHSGLAGHIAGWLLLPVEILALIGLTFQRKSALAWLTIAALGLVVVSSAATITKPRFRFPCDPILCEFAVAGFIGLRAKSQESQSAQNKDLGPT